MPPGEETSSDLLRHLAIGAIARAERGAGGSLRTIYCASVGTASWTFRTLDRWTDNRLMRPFRRPIEVRLRRLGDQVAEMVEEGKREEQDSRVLAAESLQSVVENIVDQVAESEEVDRLIMELVGQKSVTYATSLVDNVRTLTATADDALEGVLRKLLRRMPRRVLPPSPLESQPQTMYASGNLVRGVADHDWRRNAAIQLSGAVCRVHHPAGGLCRCSGHHGDHCPFHHAGRRLCGECFSHQPTAGL